MGDRQREWLLGELAQADRHGLVVWVDPDLWLAPANPASDTWGGFADERAMIADAIAENDIDNLLMVSGDAHMLAFDDGANTDYSSSQAGGFPLFHTAAVDRPISVKGGPYTGPGSIAEYREIWREVTGRAPRGFPMPVWMFERFVGTDLTTMWRWLRTADLAVDPATTHRLLPTESIVKQWLVRRQSLESASPRTAGGRHMSHG